MSIDWKPQEDFAIIIDDKTGWKRSDRQLNSMVEEVRRVVNEYGFDLSHWGSWRCVSKQARYEALIEIREMLDKLDILKKE